MAPDHRKQIDNLKKFSVDFRVSISFILSVTEIFITVRASSSSSSQLHPQLQSSSNSDPAFDQMMTKPPREQADKPKDLPLDKASMAGREGAEDGVLVISAGTPGGAPAPSAAAAATTNASKPGSPAALSPSPSATDQKRAALDVTSQGVQTTAPSTFSGSKHEEKEEKKEAVQE